MYKCQIEYTAHSFVLHHLGQDDVDKVWMDGYPALEVGATIETKGTIHF